MSHQLHAPFDSIESAQQYIRILLEVVAEASRDVDNEITIATGQMSYRPLQALRIVEYTLEKLQRHLCISSRTLNDLRSLRRLLFEERSVANPRNLYHVLKSPALTDTPTSSTAAQQI